MGREEVVGSKSAVLPVGSALGAFHSRHVVHGVLQQAGDVLNECSLQEALGCGSSVLPGLWLCGASVLLCFTADYLCTKHGKYCQSPCSSAKRAVGASRSCERKSSTTWQLHNRRVACACAHGEDASCRLHPHPCVFVETLSSACMAQSAGPLQTRTFAVNWPAQRSRLQTRPEAERNTSTSTM